MRTGGHDSHFQRPARRPRDTGRLGPGPGLGSRLSPPRRQGLQARRNRRCGRLPRRVDPPGAPRVRVDGDADGGGPVRAAAPSQARGGGAGRRPPRRGTAIGARRRDGVVLRDGDRLVADGRVQQHGGRYRRADHPNAGLGRGGCARAAVPEDRRAGCGAQGAGRRRSTLARADLVQLEVSVLPYNEGAPTMLEVLAYMDARGFAPYDLSGITRPRVAFWARSTSCSPPKDSPLRPDSFEF